MHPVVAIIRYQASPAQQALPEERWHERARQIGGMAGLRWKIWIAGAAPNERGGIYLYDTEADARAATAMLVRSLGEAGAVIVESDIVAVDVALSRLTHAPIDLSRPLDVGTAT